MAEDTTQTEQPEQVAQDDTLTGQNDLTGQVAAAEPAAEETPEKEKSAGKAKASPARPTASGGQNSQPKHAYEQVIAPTPGVAGEKKHAYPGKVRGMMLVGVFTVILEAFIMIVLVAASFLGNEPFELSAVRNETILILPRSSMSMIALLSLFIAIAVSVAIQHTIVDPMRRMTWHMNELAQGDFSTRMPPNKRFEIKEARQFTESFNKAAEELAGTEIMRSNFISDFSHEFRTPIASISGFAQLLRDPDLSPEERNDYLDIIVDESKRLSNLSEDILSLSRMESTSILQNVENVNVTETLRRSIAVVGVKAAAKNVSIDFKLAECNVEGNSDYLSQLWTNILDNAIKFSPEGGKVSVELAERTMLTDPARREVVCKIADEGCGMDERTRTHLFDRFYQGDTSHAQEGNGLGLALCKRIVDLHEGGIRVESAPDAGSTFIVSIPCSR